MNPTNHPKPSSMRRPAGRALVLLIAVVWAVVQHGMLAPLGQWESARDAGPQGIEAANMSAFGVILGEMRASMADLMWVKTERYLHRGVAFEAHLNDAALTENADDDVHVHDEHCDHGHDHADHSHDHEHDHAGREHAHDHDDHDDHADHDSDEGHGAMAAMIPEADHDYRGFIGRLHREVAPWQGPDAPHEHTSGEELIPWYRVLTLSNPQHTRGYVIGAWWLSQEDDPEASDKALGFIKEGIEHNPAAPNLWLMRGRLELEAGRHEAAVESFEAAVRHSLALRPEGGPTRNGPWTEFEEEDFADACRYRVVVLWRKLGRLSEALAATREARHYLPDDTPLANMEAQLVRLVGP